MIPYGNSKTQKAVKSIYIFKVWCQNIFGDKPDLSQCEAISRLYLFHLGSVIFAKEIICLKKSAVPIEGILC